MLQPSPPSSLSSSSGSSMSRLSFLSTSSSSTLSDFSVSSLPSPPASGSKTHAFFASPFPTRPPSPTPAPPPPLPTKTHAFFAIPAIDVSSPTPTTPKPSAVLEHESSEPTPRPSNREPDLSVLLPVADSTDEPRAGSLIAAEPAALCLLKPLGHGAFSSVWLADDLSPVPLVLRSRRSLHDLRRQASLKSPRSAKSPPASATRSFSLSSLSRAGSLRRLRARVPGTRPILSLATQNDEAMAADEQGVLTSSLSRASSTSSTASCRQRPPAISIVDPAATPTRSRLVAVKMTVRGGAAVEDEEREREKERTRVAFVREVEVLRHISHPNITPLLTHLSTPTHHVLVLPFLPGGDLLQLVNTDDAWSRLREPVLQRMWHELCRAVAWMHSVGLVHRDIKLENILLTTPIYTALQPTSPAPALADLPAPPAPLIKLTDFGLSRFVDIRSQEERRRDQHARRAASGRDDLDGAEDEDSDTDADSGPLLSTRCGSEAYAAPELVMGGSAPPRSEPSPPPAQARGGRQREREPRGVYDARETDAWACGVVLYALVARRLPFGEGESEGLGGVGVGVGVGGGVVREGAGKGRGHARGRMARRAWLMRIARGEYEWPEVEEGGEGGQGEEEEELVGPTLARSEGARRVVGRLLVRDPRRRARVGDLWGDVWMGGNGEVERLTLAEVEANGEEVEGGETQEDEEDEARGEEDEEEEEEEMGEEELEEALREAEEEVETDGWLVDQEGIGDVARREVV